MIRKYLIVLLFFFGSVLTAQGVTDEAVNSAWEKLCSNRIKEAAQEFSLLQSKDKNNLRVNLALYYLNHYRGMDGKAWEAFSSVLESRKDFQPYLFALLSPLTARLNETDNNREIVDKLTSSLEYPDSLQMLPAMVRERLAQYYLQKDDIDKCRELNAAVNPVLKWKLIGPFDNISASGYDKVFPPETGFESGKTYTGKNGVPASWFAVDKIRLDNWIDFNKYFAFNNAIYYGNTFVYSPEKRKVLIRIGTSGSLKAFLNDYEIYHYFDENNNDLDTYIVETELQQGWNRLLIKCGFSEIQSCNFLVRITDLKGNKIDDLKISADAQEYKKADNLYTKVIPNFAEEYFKTAIKNHPDFIENYLLLADSYSRNDKAIEAELILKKALEKYPNSALIMTQLLEAYLRGEKYDEYNTTREKLYSLDEENPVFIGFKAGKFMANQDFDSAEEYYNKLKTAAPGIPAVYSLGINLYAKKRNFEKVIALSKEAYAKYPLDWEFAAMEYTITVAVNKDMEAGLKILDDYLSRNRTITALFQKTKLLLQMGRIDDWEESYLELLEMEPAASGYYSDMSSTFFSLQNYEKSEKYIRMAIDICPNSSQMWSQLAEIQRIKGSTSDAIASYKTALVFNHSNYDAREKLRELQGKPPVFSYFKEFNIDSLVKNCPTSADLPEDQALIVLDKMDRVVYEEGSSEYSKEFMVRVFNSNGIDAFKEYWIPYNSYAEGMILDKAVVIKKDGSEIPADTDGGQVVFKSLEPDDFIYVKYKIKNYYNGKLSDQFWDESYFSYYFPVLYASYSILVPDNKQFNYSAQNMDKTPVSVKQTDDGKLYEWVLTKQNAVKYEYNMPSILEVGKALFISSLKDWNYLVDWYKDITYTKVRPSYEISETVRNLMNDKSLTNTDDRIRKIYEYITNNIQYSSVPFRQSAFTPQSARDVLVTKIGDCKDLATLCIAMLKEIGVKANYVLVNTKDEGLNKHILPSIAFNHAIVSVESDKGPVFLDLTAKNYPYASLPEADRGAFSLLIKKGNENSMYIHSGNIVESKIIRDTKCAIDANSGINIISNATKEGAVAGRFKGAFRFSGAAERSKTMSEELSQDYPNLVLNSFDSGNIDSDDDIVNYTLDMTIPEYISDAGDFKMLKIPWSDKLDPLKALSYDARDYPFIYWPNADSTYEKIEISLPEGYVPVVDKGENKFSYPGGSYKMHYSFSKNKITGERTIVFNKSEIEANDYVEFKNFYNNVIKTDGQVLLLKKK